MLRIVAAACWVIAGAQAQARPSLAGDPPLTRHTPDVEVYPQNFSLTQDAQSVVYVANNDGVLVFDGERWELLPLPNKDLVRVVAFDGAERVYVGGFDQFGYLERDAAGRDIFHDLTPAFAPLLAGEAFEDIWDVHIAAEGVFFRALRHVFLYEPASGATRLWRHAGRFGGIVQMGRAVVLQFRGEGLKQFVDGEWQLLPGSEPLSELVWDFVRLPDGGLLTLGADGRWRAYRDGRVVDYPVPRSFPASSAMSEGIELADGTLVMVSDDGFVYTLDPRSGAHRRFRVDPGYLNDVIVARGGGLLIASEDGVLHLEWPAPWTSLGEAYGLSSSLTAMARWGEGWYALTSSGVFALEEEAAGAARFRPLEWTAAEAWDLLGLDADTALLAESYGLKLVSGGQARAMTHTALYPRVLRRSQFDANVVFVGLEPGVAVLRRQGGTWRLVMEEHALEALQVQGIVEPEPRVLWLGSERGGVWRVRFAPDYAALEETRRFGPSDGITYGELPGGAITQLPDGTLVATTNTGQFRWTGERFEAIDLNGLGHLRDKDEWVELAVAPDGARWGYSYKHVYRETRAGWHREEIGAVRRGAIESVAFDESGAPLFSTTHGVLRFDGTQMAGGGAPAVRLRALERRDAAGGIQALPLQAGAALALPHGDYGLLVRFALPEFRRPGAVQYSTRLSGLEARFSDWSGAHTLQYPRLPAGDYTLEVAARDGLGRESHIEPLRLTLEPAWYAGALARALWLVVVVAALSTLTAAVVRWRTARLERLVAARTSELRAANERLDAMAHLDGLTGVSNRRELDRHLEKVWVQCEKSNSALSVLAIDVDNFKRYNDQHGHLAGDEMLVRLVRAASACLDSRTDLLARFGGDEFFAVRVGADRAVARDLAEAIRKRIESAALGATVSVGIATHTPRGSGTVRDLVRAADAALYTAKATGRNRVAS